MNEEAATAADHATDPVFDPVTGTIGHDVTRSGSDAAT